MKPKAKRFRKAVSPVLSMRIRKPLMAKLQKSAKAENRSISEEAGVRLDASFARSTIESDIRRVVGKAVSDSGPPLVASLDLNTTSLVVWRGEYQRSFSIEGFLILAFDGVHRITDQKMALKSAERLSILSEKIEQVRARLFERAKEIEQFRSPRPPQASDIEVHALATGIESRRPTNRQAKTNI